MKSEKRAPSFTEAIENHKSTPRPIKRRWWLSLSSSEFSSASSINNPYLAFMRTCFRPFPPRYYFQNRGNTHTVFTHWYWCATLCCPSYLQPFLRFVLRPSPNASKKPGAYFSIIIVLIGAFCHHGSAHMVRCCTAQFTGGQSAQVWRINTLLFEQCYWLSQRVKLALPSKGNF